MLSSYNSKKTELILLSRDYIHDNILSECFHPQHGLWIHLYTCNPRLLQA